MDVATKFLLGLLSLVLIGVVFLIILNAFEDTSFALDKVAVVNETLGFINETGYILAGASYYGFSGVSFTQVFNDTDATLLLAGNYTIDSLGNVTNASTVNYNNVSFSYTYDRYNDIVTITDNSSTGVTDFFSNASTWLALLAIIVIIMIISVVVIVVRKFG